MNKPKKIIIIVWLSLVVFACVYVPWILYGFSVNYKYSSSYSFIWNPPDGVFGVDTARLVFELIGISALCGMSFILADILKKKQ